MCCRCFPITVLTFMFLNKNSISSVFTVGSSVSSVFTVPWLPSRCALQWQENRIFIRTGCNGGIGFCRAWVGSFSFLLPTLGLPFLASFHSGKSCFLFLHLQQKSCSSLFSSRVSTVLGEGTAAPEERRREGKQVVQGWHRQVQSDPSEKDAEGWG